MTDIMDPSSAVDDNQHILLFTESQQQWMFWLPKPFALLSMSCSLLILYVLCSNAKERLAKVYGRIWLGICVGNTVTNLFVLISTLTAPEGTYYGSMGSDASCTASAAVMHWFLVATTVYNGFLGVYYFVSIHKHCTDRCLSRYMEPWFHAAAVTWPTVGVILGLTYKLYGASDIFLYCWVSPTPFSCRQNEDLACTEGGYESWWRPLFIWGMGLVDLNLFTSLKLFGIAMIYVTLFRQHAKMKQKYHTNSNQRYNSVARETAFQAYCFLAACLIPYTFKIAARLIDMFAPASFWEERASPAFATFCIIMQAMFPLQGVLNAVIFFRPKILHRQRERKNRDESTMASFYAVLRPKWAAEQVVLKTQHGHNVMFSNETGKESQPDSARAAYGQAVNTTHTDMDDISSSRDFTKEDQEAKAVFGDSAHKNNNQQEIIREEEETETEAEIMFMDTSEITDVNFIIGEDMPEDCQKCKRRASQHGPSSAHGRSLQPRHGNNDNDGRYAEKHEREDEEEAQVRQSPSNSPTAGLSSIPESVP